MDDKTWELMNDLRGFIGAVGYDAQGKSKDPWYEGIATGADRLLVRLTEYEEKLEKEAENV